MPIPLYIAPPHYVALAQPIARPARPAQAQPVFANPAIQRLHAEIGDAIPDYEALPWNIDSDQPKYKKTKPMNFEGLNIRDRIHLTKKEFAAIVKTIFEHPEGLKVLVTEKKLTNKQSKAIFTCVNKLNAMNCACCRKFNPSLLKLTPIETELEPLLDIAQNNVKTRTY